MTTTIQHVEHCAWIVKVNREIVGDGRAYVESAEDAFALALGPVETDVAAGKIGVGAVVDVVLCFPDARQIGMPRQTWRVDGEGQLEFVCGLFGRNDAAANRTIRA